MITILAPIFQKILFTETCLPSQSREINTKLQLLIILIKWWLGSTISKDFKNSIYFENTEDSPHQESHKIIPIITGNTIRLVVFVFVLIIHLFTNVLVFFQGSLLSCQTLRTENNWTWICIKDYQHQEIIC